MPRWQRCAGPSKAKKLAARLVFGLPTNDVWMRSSRWQQRTQRAKVALRLSLVTVVFPHLHKQAVHFVVDLGHRAAWRHAHRRRVNESAACLDRAAQHSSGRNARSFRRALQQSANASYFAAPLIDIVPLQDAARIGIHHEGFMDDRRRAGWRRPSPVRCHSVPEARGAVPRSGWRTFAQRAAKRHQGKRQSPSAAALSAGNSRRSRTSRSTWAMGSSAHAGHAEGFGGAQVRQGAFDIGPGRVLREDGAGR